MHLSSTGTTTATWRIANASVRTTRRLRRPGPSRARREMTQPTETVDQAKAAVQHPARTARRNALSAGGAGIHGWRGSVSSRRESVRDRRRPGAHARGFQEGGKATSCSRGCSPRSPTSRPRSALSCLRPASPRMRSGVSCRRSPNAKRTTTRRRKGKETKRAGYVGRGLIYAALTSTTIKLLTSSSGGGELQSEQAQAEYVDGLRPPRRPLARRPSWSRDRGRRALECVPRLYDEVRGQMAYRTDERSRTNVG